MKCNGSDGMERDRTKRQDGMKWKRTNRDGTGGTGRDGNG